MAIQPFIPKNIYSLYEKDSEAYLYFIREDVYKVHIIVVRYVFYVYNKRERILRMKHRDLIKRLEAAGFVFYRHGGNHDIYIRDGKIEQVPRHKEINEQLAKAIIKKWDL